MLEIAIVQQAMLDAVKSVVAGKSAWYISSPITTGQRYLDWLDRQAFAFVDIDHASETLQSDHATEVVTQNIEHAQIVVDRLRRELTDTIIDPTSVPPQAGWSQRDWRSFWVAVIERYVSKVVFADGWEFSSGCCFEFLAACRGGLLIYDESLSPLSAPDGVRMIGVAISEMASRGKPTDFLRSIVVELET